MKKYLNDFLPDKGEINYTKTSDGVKLSGWYLDNPNTESIVLYFHGNGENILNNLYGNIMKKDELPALPQSATIESIKLDIIAQFINSSNSSNSSNSIYIIKIS